MLEKLKQIAMQKLQEKMLGNSLNQEATQAAAGEGVNALIESLKGGDLSQITALFSGGSAEGNGIAQNLQGKLQEILQAKGMSSEEAQAESQNGAADLLNGLKDKFQSAAPEDKEFDLSNITSLLGGNAGNIGGILNTAKSLFGK
jgi:hypothetical protein